MQLTWREGRRYRNGNMVEAKVCLKVKAAHLDGGVCQRFKPQILVKLTVTFHKPVAKALLLKPVTCTSAQAASIVFLQCSCKGLVQRNKASKLYGRQAEVQKAAYLQQKTMNDIAVIAWN